MGLHRMCAESVEIRGLRNVNKLQIGVDIASSGILSCDIL
jgi:hypothetical protein